MSFQSKPLASSFPGSFSILRNPFSLLLVLLCALSLQAQEKKRLSFDQIFRNAEPRLTVALPSLDGWADDSHYLQWKKKEGDDHSKLYSVDAVTGAEKLARDLAQFKELLPEGIDPSLPVAQNEAYARLIYAKDSILYYLNTETKVLKQLTKVKADNRNPTMSPDGNSVAFTRKNDLYAIDLNSGKEIRYTRDGSEAVYNGWASWVYYEEILGRGSRYRAFWWSPDSKRLGFYRFDDSPVPIYPIYNSRGTDGFLENTRYPHAGDPNPYVRIGIVPVTGGNVVWAAFDEKADQYFGPPFWTPDGKRFLVQWMNRRQDTLLIVSVDPATGSRKTIYTESQPSWVDWFASITFLPGGGDFILKSDKDGWPHFYLFRADGTLRNRLTSGRWSVEEILAVNEKSGMVYFTGKKEASTRTDLYSVRLDGSDLRRLTFGDYTHSVSVSPGGSYFCTTYSNYSTPSKMALYTGTGTLVRELGDSKAKDFDEYARGKTELFTIQTTDGYQLPAIWTLPTDFDPHKRYPVLFSEYGGPNAPSVADGWGGIRDQWLANEGVIQISVDHRGTGHFGKEGVALMYRNLGKWEMNDYIEAVKWLRKQPFVDSTKICITGGSYGGYVTCLALTAGADYFTHGVAEFSVVDWTLYDSHYVERYMDTPEHNPEGYKNGSVLTYASKYKGMLEIIHGTMDDNVHEQNTLQLIDTLENLNKHFLIMLYPDVRHGWGGPKATHLRNEVYRFYYEYLIGEPFPEELFKTAGSMGGGRRRRP